MMDFTDSVIVFLLIWIINYTESISVQQCNYAMGMGNGMLRNDQLLASSNEEHAGNARLHGDRAWRAESHSDEWFQVDFRRQVHVSAITTQGFFAAHHVECVTRYRVAHAIEEDEWRYVMGPENEEEKVFYGNHDRSTPVYHAFHRPIRLRYLRIDITGCKHKCALRFELYGCELHHVSEHTTASTTPIQHLPRTSARLARVTNRAIAPQIPTTMPTPSKAQTTTMQLVTTKPASVATYGRPKTTTSSLKTKGSQVIPTTTSKKAGLLGNVAAVQPAGESSSSSAKHVMKKGPIIIGVAAFAGLLLIVLAIVGIWLFKRNRSSIGSKQVAVMQNIGPYEITTPGLTRNPGYESMPDIDADDTSMPDPAASNDHDNAAYVITRIGSKTSAASQGTAERQADKRPTSGWEDNKIYAVND